MKRFLEFKKQWEDMPIQERMDIAIHTDVMNNTGVLVYKMGNITEAIKYYEEALEIMPINDDALSNLVKCYKKVGLFSKIPLLLRKLYIINPTNGLKEKIIAFSLVSLIIDNYEDDDDTGMVSQSIIIEETKKSYGIDITDDDLMRVYNKINEQYSANILTWGNINVGSFLFSGQEKKYYFSESNVPRSLLRGELGDILNW